MAPRFAITPQRLAWVLARPLAIALAQRLARAAFHRAAAAYAQRRARRATWQDPAPGGGAGVSRSRRLVPDHSPGGDGRRPGAR
ncbi:MULTISPECIES: hypothetical protein [Streptomyces]|uniref:hypothetical protein n=1 Tax=Streptomyces TaxID=1883 RepID=UPI000CD59941|nr:MULTISPECIES: hypothetical protein [Streptomyces]